MLGATRWLRTRGLRRRTGQVTYLEQHMVPFLQAAEPEQHVESGLVQLLHHTMLHLAAVHVPRVKGAGGGVVSGTGNVLRRGRVGWGGCGGLCECWVLLGVAAWRVGGSEERHVIVAMRCMVANVYCGSRWGQT